MTSNMGKIDRVIRIVLAAAFFTLVALGVVRGPLAWLLGALAVVFAATSVVAFCPLYLPFKFSTKPKA
ncbi:MAG: DUF2892 domain-containing protein [Spirochaetes bacterium]|nr:DUF2892 domain-containing protein [Spirochaetota bacterium]